MKDKERWKNCHRKEAREKNKQRGCGTPDWLLEQKTDISENNGKIQNRSAV